MPGAPVPPARPPWNWPLVYLGVALTALATSVLELALARLFSVLFPPYFAFAAVSMALLGLAAGGLFSYLFPGGSSRLSHRLGLTALAGSAVVVAAAVLLLGEGFAGAGPNAVLAAMAPFFLGGIVFATAAAEGLSRVNCILSAAFAGAAVGCLLWVPLVASLGGPNTLIGAAVLFAACSAVWFTAAGSLRGRVVAVAVALAWVTLIAWNVRHHTIEVKWAKGGRLEAPLVVRWNSYSRVAVVAGPAGARTLEVDAEQEGRIAEEDPERVPPAERQALLHAGAGIPYLLRPNARALIVNPGGGEEVLRAVLGGAGSITAVETNPLIAHAIDRQGAARVLFARPEVRWLVADGRSFLRREQERYDIVRILPASVRAAFPGGVASVLGDGRLFTVEAFSEYLERLRGAGLLVVSASGSDPSQRTSLLVGALLAALRRAGEREPEHHLMLFREPIAGARGFVETLVASRRPWAEADLQRARSLAAAGNVELLPPDRLDGNLSGQRGGLGSPSDNRPFLDGDPAWSQGPDPPAGRMNSSARLFGLAGFSTAVVAGILALPPLWMRRRMLRGQSLFGFAPYFVLTGAGSVLVQAGLIQGLLPWLGSPSLALAVGMPAVFGAAGAGSYCSVRVAGGSDRSLVGVLALSALAFATLAVVIAPVARFEGSLPRAAGIALTLLLVMPAGFLMGIPIAAGLARLASQAAPAARWAWSLHAAAGVLGSVTAVLLAVHAGLREAMLFGGLMYLGALPAVRFAPRRSAAGWAAPV